MAHGLSDEELAEFREIFNLVDADGSGEISREELGELISTLGLKVSVRVLIESSLLGLLIIS